MAALTTSLGNPNQPALTLTSLLDSSLYVRQAYQSKQNGPNLRLNLSIWLLAVLSLMLLGLRIWCKLLRRRRLWWDDYLLIASWACLFLGCSLQSADVRLGYGIEPTDLTPSQLITSRLMSQIAGFFLILAAVWSKTSFAVTLLRISDGWTKRAVWFVLVSINLVISVSVAIQWFWCWPSAYIWDRSVPASCMPRNAVNGYNMAAAGYSGAMDIFLAILPWKIVWSLSMNRREKFGVACAMSMGVFAGVTSFLKIPTILAIDQPGIINVINLMVFSTAESAITIMAASIPVLRMLIRSKPGPPPDMSIAAIDNN